MGCPILSVAAAQPGHQPALEEFLQRALRDLGRTPKREHGTRFPAPRERHIFLLTVYESLTYSPYDTALEGRIFYLLCLAIVLVTNYEKKQVVNRNSAK